MALHAAVSERWHENPATHDELVESLRGECPSVSVRTLKRLLAHVRFAIRESDAVDLSLTQERGLVTRRFVCQDVLDRLLTPELHAANLKDAEAARRARAAAGGTS